MYITGKQLTNRIKEIADLVYEQSNHVLSFEEYIGIPFFGQIILRFVINKDEYTLEDLDRYETMLNEIVGDEFLVDFMGTVYKEVGVDFSTLEQRMREMAEQFRDEEITDSIHASGIREDAENLLKMAELDVNSPVWEIQLENNEIILLLMGKGNGFITTIDEPLELYVMETDGAADTGLIKGTIYCKKHNISLARVLLNRLDN